jgi:hypothetical protein
VLGEYDVASCTSAVLIALNLRDEAVEADLALPAYAARSARDLIAGQTTTVAAGGGLRLSFQPYERRVLWLRSR